MCQSDAGAQYALMRGSFYSHQNDKTPRYAVWTFVPHDARRPTLRFRVPLDAPTSHVIGAFCHRIYAPWSAHPSSTSLMPVF